MQSTGFINQLKEYEGYMRRYRHEDKPSRYLDLPTDMQESLMAWIEQRITATKTANYNHTCYGLMHMFQFYVYSGAFKGAMLKAGHLPVDARRQNWNFRISLKK